MLVSRKCLPLVNRVSDLAIDRCALQQPLRLRPVDRDWTQGALFAALPRIVVLRVALVERMVVGHKRSVPACYLLFSRWAPGQKSNPRYSAYGNSRRSIRRGGSSLWANMSRWRGEPNWPVPPSNSYHRWLV